jgi:hypothetical protein
VPCFSMANMMTASLRASATRALRIVDRLAMSSAHVFSARLPRYRPTAPMVAIRIDTS